MVNEMFANSIIGTFSYSMYKQESLQAYLSGNQQPGECLLFTHYLYATVVKLGTRFGSVFLVRDMVRNIGHGEKYCSGDNLSHYNQVE